jgi:hypothetical protein
MRISNTLRELREDISQQVSSEEVFLKNQNAFEIFSNLEKSELLIDIQTNVIGDNENALFLCLYTWLRNNNYKKPTVYLLFPPTFGHFSPIFISTLYLINHGIKSYFIVVGHEKNGRTYAFKQYLYSGLFSKENLDFFIVKSYSDDENALLKVFGKNSTEKNPNFEISDKILPFIEINEDNYKYYFDDSNSIENLSYNRDIAHIAQRETYNEWLLRFSSLFQKSLTSMSFDKSKYDYVSIHYYKLLNNIYWFEKGADFTNYFYKIYEHFIKGVEKQPVYQMFILLSLLSQKVVRNVFTEIYKKHTQIKSDNPNISTFLKIKKEEILNDYLAFLQGQNDLATQIFNGIKELAKNTISHTRDKQSILAVRSIKEKDIKVLKNNNSERELWQNYFNTNENDNFLDEEEKFYLEISIADCGKTGIIETTVNHTVSDNEWRDIPKTIKEKDHKTLIHEIDKIDSNKEKETQLLYNLYFNKSGSLLRRQKIASVESLGLYNFSEFIRENNGIFSLKTNKYKSESETISFSLYKDNECHVNDSNSPFGTAYNIVVPIVKQRKKAVIVSKEPKEKNAPPITVFEKMLSLEATPKKYDIDWKEFKNKNIEIAHYQIRESQQSSENYIEVYSLGKKLGIQIDESYLYRFINYIRENNNFTKSFIIRNIPESVISKTLDYEKIFNIKTDIFSKDIIFLLISTDNKTAVLLGDNKEKCKKINFYLSENNRNFEFILKGKVNYDDVKSIISTLKNNMLFVGDNQILQTDVFEIGEDGLSEFEQNIKKRLEEDIDSGGYNWRNAHLKISSKLHINDFIYGKKLFQRNSETSTFAFLLAKNVLGKIHEDIDKPEHTGKSFCYTLIGYGYYSELLVSRTCEFLNYVLEKLEKRMNITVEYVIVKDEEEMRFSRYFQNLKTRPEIFKKAEERLIVVIPISSTLTTCLKIENQFENQFNKEKRNFPDKKPIFVSPFYTIVIVGHNIDFEDLKKKENWEKEENIAVKQVWKSVEDNRTIITENREKNKEERKNQFNVYVKSEWNLPKDCYHCFPKEDPKYEQPLFNTDKVSVTPSLIFDKPQWYNYNPDNQVYFYFKPKEGNENTDIESIYEKNSNSRFLKYDMIDWAHYESGHKHKHYTYYTHYPTIVKENRKRIEGWAKHLKKDNTQNVLLIAPDKNENGEFLHIINRYVFDDSANIIKFDKSSDYFVNFKKFFIDSIDTHNLSIYFVDNLMASSNTFLSLYEDVINALNCDPEFVDNKLRFSGIFCLINRMDYVCYKNVQDILGENKEQFFSFMQINVPENLNPLIYCPLCKTDEMFRELIQSTSCDCVKRYYIDKELMYFQKIPKTELTEKDFPYTRKKESSTLLKIMLIHFIYKAFSDETIDDKQLKGSSEERENQICNAKNVVEILNGKGKRQQTDFNDFVNLFKQYIDRHNQTNYFEIKKDDRNNIKFKANLIKILTHNHLRRHRYIKIAIFGWVRDELITATKTILEPDNSLFEILSKNCRKLTADEAEYFIEIFNYLRVLIKYGAILKTAYLLNKDFLKAMHILISNTSNFIVSETSEKKVKDNEFSLRNFKIYCTAHIVRSLRKNEQRSIQLEKNLKEILGEAIIKDENTSFFELLVLENTSIIRQTLETFKEEAEKGMSIDIDDLFEKGDYRIKDFSDCYGLNEKERLKNTWNLRKKLDNTESIVDNDAGNIVKEMAEIVGYKIDEEGCGGLLLLKYQSLKDEELQKNNESNYIVIGNSGKDNTLKDYFEQNDEELGNSLAIKLLEGTKYLHESDNDKETEYQWTNFTVYFDENVWKGQTEIELEINRDKTKDISQCAEIKKLNKQIRQPKAKRILFIRVAEQEIGFDKKDKTTVGDAVFVFYDDKDHNQCQREDDRFSICNVRFAHILHNELISYFNHRYNDDTFRAWVKQKEIANYTLTLNHGISDYFTLKTENITEAKNNSDYIDHLDKLFDYIINKMWLSSILHLSKEEIREDERAISINDIVSEFKTKYREIFYFVNPKYPYRLTNEDCEKYIDFNTDGINSDHLQKQVLLPDGFYIELVFELFYNIRKHVIQDRLYSEIIKDENINKLKIYLKTELQKNVIHLSVENNHFYSEEKKKGYIHGLILLKKVLVKHKYGNLEVIKSKETNTFKVIITLKILEK